MRNRPLQRKNAESKTRPIVAYDLETTRISAETPTPLYITAFDGQDLISKPLRSFDDLRSVLVNDILPRWPDHRFVAWNGNRFDAYLICLALVTVRGYQIKPYLARNKSLRGALITNGKNKWELLDGMAMTGVEKKLGVFVATYAPAFPKLNLDLENIPFDPRDADHVAYAERDSIALWHAMQGANRTVERLTGMELLTTIGALGIRFFQSRMPLDKLAWRAPEELRAIFFTDLMRGGYCHCVQKYKGPVWKYDINQAYAAAMRDARLPAGRVTRTRRYREGRAGFYQISARVKGQIPFYTKRAGNAQWDMRFEAWVTADEMEQLYAEDANVNVRDGWVYDDHFSMRDMVNDLERLRMADPAGPNGPQGLMCKSLGNHAYGKTVEQLEGVDLIMAMDCPPKYLPYGMGADTPELQYLWYRQREPLMREWHKPQIGVTITAYNRMMLRRAALSAPDAWLYADTDCCMYSRPVDLDVHPSRYGAWKEECAGVEHVIIDKKVYASSAGIHAKGLHRKKLDMNDMQLWFDGEFVPVQWQTQRVNFLKAMTGSAMFHSSSRRGTMKKEAAP